MLHQCASLRRATPGRNQSANRRCLVEHFPIDATTCSGPARWGVGVGTHQPNPRPTNDQFLLVLLAKNRSLFDWSRAVPSRFLNGRCCNPRRQTLVLGGATLGRDRIPLGKSPICKVPDCCLGLYHFPWGSRRRLRTADQSGLPRIGLLYRNVECEDCRLPRLPAVAIKYRPRHSRDVARGQSTCTIRQVLGWLRLTGAETRGLLEVPIRRCWKSPRTQENPSWRRPEAH